jgi:hypothetical protein
MWAYLAKICMTTGTAPDQITPAVYSDARRLIHGGTVITVRGYRPKTLSTPLLGLDSVMFHRGQAPPPDIRRRWTGRPAKEVTWEELTAKAPVLVATMRRYIDQCLLSLRSSSVACFDTTFRTDRRPTGRSRDSTGPWPTAGPMPGLISQPRNATRHCPAGSTSTITTAPTPRPEAGRRSLADQPPWTSQLENAPPRTPDHRGSPMGSDGPEPAINDQFGTGHEARLIAG